MVAEEWRGEGRLESNPRFCRSAVVRVGISRVRATGRPIVLSRQYLAQFGRIRIPAPLWQALGQCACQLDPVIFREWRQLTANRYSTANRHSATTWGAAASDNAIADRDDAAEGGPATDDAFEWTESRYDTRVALERAKRLRRWRICAEMRVVDVADSILSAHRSLFSVGAVAE